MKRDIRRERQLYEYPADIRLPCVKGTDGMRPSIVDAKVSPRLDLEVVCEAGHEVNRVSVAHWPGSGMSG